MKVVCVDDSLCAHHGECIWPNGYIVRGEAYTVLEVFEAVYPDRRLAYELAEKPVLHKEFLHSAQGGWETRRFVPLSYFEAEFCVTETISEPEAQPA